MMRSTAEVVRLFWRLGVTNARRNLSRSMLSVVSMAVAAMVLSAALFLAAGYPAQAYLLHRVFAGGDIMIYPRALSLASPAGANESGGADYGFSRMPRDWISELYAYSPEVYDYGVFMSSTAAWFDLDEITARIERVSGVTDIYPYLTLPAFESYYDRQAAYDRGGLTAIRGRSIDKDLRYFYLQEFIVSGRPLSVMDYGLYRAIVDLGRGGTAGYGEPGAFGGVSGGGIDLLIPRLSIATDDGTAAFDYADMVPYRFRVVGGYVLKLGDDSSGRSAPAYATPQVIVPDDTFHEIWAAVTGGAPVAVPQVTVSVANLYSVETVASRLREALPDCTVVSVPQAARIAEMRGLPQGWSRTRSSASLQVAAVAGEVSLPGEVKYLLLGLTSMLAALVVAANSLVMLTQRRQEIGVLRALGAARRDIMMMVLSEVSVVSTIGAAIGYGFVRAAVVYQQLTGRASLAAIGVEILRDGLLVVGLCVAGAILFGLAPAVRSTAISTMEVLRQE